MAERKGYYRSVPGSRDLLTRKEMPEDLILKIENEVMNATPPGPVSEYQDSTLGGVLLKGAMVSVPEEIFESLFKKLEPIEQSVYLQLFRLAYGMGRNFLRVGKRELSEKTNLSLLRLNSALEGLVKKGMIKPIHRSVRGTLWRVSHPQELGEVVNYQVQEGKRIKLSPIKPQKTKHRPPPEKPLESPLNIERFAELSPQKPDIALKDIARKFFELKREKPNSDQMDDALSIITGLLEDGFTRRQVLFAVEWFAENFPKEKDLSRVPYYIAKSLEEYKGD